jgi:hypothetical protein
LTLVGCASRPAPNAEPWVPEPAPDLGAVVARVGEVPIFAAEVSAQASHTGKSPRAALDDLIALHLLAERAREAWPPQAPELRKQVLVQRLLERELEPTLAPENVPDVDLRPFYERAHALFVHSRQVDVAVLHFPFRHNTTPEQQAAGRLTMAQLAAVFAQRGHTLEALLALAGDPAWQSRGVQYFRFLQSETEPYSPQFAKAALALDHVGQVTGVLEDPWGLNIALYLGDRPARNTPFEEVRLDMRKDYYPRWRQTRFAEFADRAAARHAVEVHPDLAGK